MTLAQKGRRVVLAGLLLLGGVYVRALAFTAVEGFQAPAQKFFYPHVPAAVTTELAVILVGLASVFFLFLKDPRLDRFAEASAEVGTVFAAIVLTTGPIWGKPIWGTWWTWDARLTSTLFLFFLLISYHVLRGAVTDAGLRARYGAVLGICAVVLVGDLGRPRVRGLVRGFDVPRLEQRPGVEPQRVGAAAGGVRPGKARGRFGVPAGAAVKIAGREGGVGALFEREHLLVGDQRIVLAVHHLERLAQEHPGIGILREPLGGVLRGGDRAPPIFNGASQPHQRRVAFPEHGAQRTAHSQPPVGAPGRVALAGGGSPHGEPHERGAQGPEHCLIMDLGPERLQPHMASQPRRHPLAGRRIVVTRAREQAGELARALEALGAEALAVPTIRIVPLAALAPLPTAP